VIYYGGNQGNGITRNIS